MRADGDEFQAAASFDFAEQFGKIGAVDSAARHAGVEHDVDHRAALAIDGDARNVVGGRHRIDRQDPSAADGQFDRCALPAEEDVFDRPKDQDWDRDIRQRRGLIDRGNRDLVDGGFVRAVERVVAECIGDQRRAVAVGISLEHRAQFCFGKERTSDDRSVVLQRGS